MAVVNLLIALDAVDYQTARFGAPTAGETADAVWDEALSGHLTAGTTGKALDTIKKSNTLIEGTVLPSPTPTTTVFSVSGINYPTGAFKHAVLLMADDASIAEQNSPMLTYVNNGDGTSTITIEEPFTAAPATGDKILIIPTTHVHSVAAIQSGLSTLTAAQVNAEIVDALSVDAYAEPTAVPAASSSLKDKLAWLFMLARNRLTQTASTQTVFRDDTTTPAATAAVSDDGTTATRSEFQ
jgi:hypothetical protein